MRRLSAVLTIAIVGGGYACGDILSPSRGTLTITAVSRSLEPGLFAPGLYTVSVTLDKAVAKELGRGDSVVFSRELSVGNHALNIEGVPATCGWSGDHSARVLENQIVHAKVAVECPRQTGDLQVTVTTTGAELDPDGYSIYKDDTFQAFVGANASKLAQYLEAGSHTITLRGVEPNCSVGSKTVLISAGTVTDVSFAVSCAASGYAKLIASSSGSDRDPDGVTFAIDQELPTFAGASRILISKLPAGAHTYAIGDLQPNCMMAVPASGTLNYPVGDTITLDASSTCHAVSLGAPAVSVTDPQGDTISSTATGKLDITRLSVRYAPGFISIVVAFVQPVTANNVAGLIYLDTDENASTGVTDAQFPQIGADYYVSLFNADSVSAPISKNGSGIGRVSARFDADSIILLVPLAKLGDDDGNMAIAAELGTKQKETDIVPNTGVIVAHVPAPISLLRLDRRGL